MEFNSGIVSYGLFINFKIDDLLLDLDLDLLLNISYDYHIIPTGQSLTPVSWILLLQAKARYNCVIFP